MLGIGQITHSSVYTHIRRYDQGFRFCLSSAQQKEQAHLAVHNESHDALWHLGILMSNNIRVIDVMMKFQLTLQHSVHLSE